MKLARPLLRWHGGKWRLAPWIIQHFPAHRSYVEPYGGAASVLLRKARSIGEVWNDLDDGAVNLFQILRDERAGELIRRLELTPFARLELQEALARDVSPDPIERARLLVVASFQGFGSNAHARRATGFRSNSNRSGTTPSQDWAHYPEALQAIVWRLRGVVIESRPALQVMAQHDRADTLHYVDPPYLWSVRSDAKGHHPKWHGYQHELDDDQHRDLLAFLRTLKGMVVLSGYPHPLYDEGLGGGWLRLDKATYADGARPRTESLWLNPAAIARGSQLRFAEAAE